MNNFIILTQVIFYLVNLMNATKHQKADDQRIMPMTKNGNRNDYQKTVTRKPVTVSGSKISATRNNDGQ